MKEFERAIEKAFVSIPESLRDYLTVKYATFWWEFGFGHGVKTPRNRYWGHQMLERWYKGEPTPLSVWATRLFDPSDFKVSFSEPPSSGPQIIVINQPNEGPLWGGWFKFALNWAVAEQRRREGKFEARWVQGEISDRSVWQSPLGIQRRRLAQMVHVSCNTVLIDPTGSNREKARSVLEMREHLRDDGILVICPEGEDHAVLGRAKEQAGGLVSLLASKLEVPIYPVGAYLEEGRLSLRFGESFRIEELEESKLFRGQLKQAQRIGDLLMVEIGKLLPEEKRGVYASVVRQETSREEAIAA